MWNISEWGKAKTQAWQDDLDGGGLGIPYQNDIGLELESKKQELKSPMF